MKKTICLVGMGLLFVSAILMGCSSVKPITLTQADLSSLKGKWEGLTTFGSIQNIRLPTTLEIYNDTVPVKGKLTIRDVPSAVSHLFAPRPNMFTGDAIIEFEDGRINDRGNLVGKQEGNHFELTLMTGEKMSMEGLIYYLSLSPSVSLNR